MTNPSQPLRVMLVGSLPGRAPSCDPAVDLDACPPDVLARYARERSDEAREAVRLKPGAAPVLFTVQPLSRTAYAWVSKYEGEQRAQFVLSVACHEYTDGRGVEVAARSHGKLEQVRPGLTVASDEWVDHLFETFGAAAVREIAQVALDRAEAGPRALAPFRLPPGLELPL